MDRSADHRGLQESVSDRSGFQRDEGSDDGELVAPEPLDGLQAAGSRVVLQYGPTSAVGDVAPHPPGRAEHLPAPVAFAVGRHPRSDQPVPQATQGHKNAAANGADAKVEGPEAVGRDSRSRTRGRKGMVQKRRFSGNTRNLSADPDQSRVGAGFRESLAAMLGLQFRENRVYPRSSSQ